MWILVKIEIFVDIIGKIVVLVDDVIYKGWIVWVVLNVVVEYGCLEVIRLVVLVDRGYRELFIYLDFIGKKLFIFKEE